MKKLYTVLCSALLIISISCSKGEEVQGDTTTANIWDGPMISFSKADGADFTLESNQDRITSMYG